MTLTHLILITLGMLLLSFLAQALFLWLGARIAKVPGATFRRVVLACVLLTVVGLALGSAVAVLQAEIITVVEGLPAASEIGVAILIIGAYLALVFLLVKWTLRTSFGRAALAGLIMLVLHTTLGYGIAFAFKTTLIEAFVIPTGSMSPTIYGAHADVTCGNCGITYAVSMSTWSGPQRGRPREIVATRCLNCDEPGQVPITAPILSGDRLVVEKLGRPKRWDLIVFRYPEDPSVNYLKRLVGLPGEKLDIAGGDVFINDSRLSKAPGVARDMWLLMHDTDYVPAETTRDRPQWRPAAPESSWKNSGGRWRFEANDVDAEADPLVFAGQITDRLAYNGRVAWDGPAMEEPATLTGDVKVDLHLDEFRGQGSLAFRWRFCDREVIARISSDGEVRISGSGTPNATTGKLSADLSQVKRLAFALRDGQAYLLENDEAVATLPVGPQDVTAAKTAAGRSSEPCRVELLAAECDLGISRIVIHKDVYYQTLGVMMPGGGLGPEGVVELPLQLGPQEHFTLGDNSTRAKDSRFWGTVSTEATTGVARWIYWPPSRWHEFR